MLRRLIFFTALIPLSAYSQLNETYYFNSGPSCTIKEYKAGALTQVDAKNFHGTPLKAKKLNRNPQFMAFKVAGKIYLSPANCLKTTSLETLEELEPDSLDDHGRDDQRDYSQKKSSDNKHSYFASENSSSSNNDYYLEFDLGIVRVGSKEIVYPDYTDLNQTEVTNTDTMTFTVGKPEASTYKTTAAFSIGGGKRISPFQFLSLKLRRYSGESIDTVPATVTHTDGSATENLEAQFQFKDTVTDIMAGSKFILLPNNNIKPVVAAYLGLSFTSSKITAVNAFISDVSMTSSAIIASLEGGFETMFSEKIGAGAMLGYQYVTSRKFKLSDDSAAQLNDFTSKKSYSNLNLSLGLKLYF